MSLVEVLDIKKNVNTYEITCTVNECSSLNDDDFLVKARYSLSSGDTAECHGFEVDIDYESIEVIDFHNISTHRIIAPKGDTKNILLQELKDNLWDIENQIKEIENEKD